MTARPAIPTPTPGATSSTFQVGTYNAITDTFTSVFDLNDATSTLVRPNGIQMPQPKKVEVTSSNIRTPGDNVVRFQYGNRHITVDFSVRSSVSPSDLVSKLRTLIQAIESAPYVLRIALPGATQYTYADVAYVEHNIPTDTQQIVVKALTGLHIDFECAPGLRGDRLFAQNLALNPGFEAPGGPATTVFSDTFANALAYSSQAGGAPTAGSITGGYTDIVMSDGPLRWMRCGEPSGAVAYDSSGQGQNGTYVSSPTLGVTGAISGDADKAITLNGTTQRVSVPVAGLPTAAAACTIEVWVNYTANPGSTVPIFAYGTGGGTNTALQISLSSTGQVFATIGSGGSTTAVTLSKTTWHLLAATYDGTTLRFYIDGVLQAGSTAVAVANSGAFCNVGCSAVASPGAFYGGSLDEAALYATALSAARLLAHYNAGNAGTGLPTLTNTLTLAAAARVAFGSPIWAALNTWQTRFRWQASGDYRWYLHYTDANNWLRAHVTGTALTLEHNIAGVPTTLATTAILPALGVWYWLRVTQFPSPIGTTAPQVQAILLNDGPAGSVGAQVASAGSVAAFDSSVAITGRPQIEATGASLILGGNFTDTHAMKLFGPGGWTFQGGTGTGQCSGAWEQSTANTYPSGPVTSYGAARVDLPPAGTVSAVWRLYTGGAPGGVMGAMPVQTAGDTIGYRVRYNTSSVSGTGSVKLFVVEYDASGSFLRTGAATSGASTAGVWGTLQNLAYVTGAGCAFVDMQLQVVDTVAAASANGIVWFDNAQVWNVSQSGQSDMAYHEIRFPQSPAQLLISGIQGDMPAPALSALGTYVASLAPNNSLGLYLGRRRQPGATARLVGGANTGFTMVLDSTAYGGCYAQTGGAAFLYTAGFVPTNTGADGQGVYHFLGRLWTSEGTLSRIAAQPIVRQTDGTLSGAFYTSAPGAIDATPFVASSTWTDVDAGQVSYPPGANGVVADPTTYPLETQVSLTDTATCQFRANWHALLPVEGELVTGQFVNPSGNLSTLTAAYTWVFLDGAGIQLNQGFGATTAPGLGANTSAPYPETGLFAFAQLSGSWYTLTLGAEPYLTLDPTTTIGGQGVNQAVALITDGSATVMPFFGEFRYSPLFLYPRA